MAKILLVEDEQDLSDLIREWLKADKHVVEVVSNGEDAVDRLKFYKYDVVILDWVLPRMSGLQVCQEYRSSGGTTPILFLTAKKMIDEKEAGLDAGSDDYLTKPFDMKELSARLRALLRRPQVFSGSNLKAGGIELDTTTRKVLYHGEELQLLPKEFALLEFLMKHQNKVFSSEALIERVWNSESDASPEVIRTYIKRLRKRLDIEGKPSLLQTVHGVGYKLEIPDES